MGLSSGAQTQYGLYVPNAYHRIEFVRHINGLKTTIYVSIFASLETRLSELPPVSRREFEVEEPALYEGETIMRWAYRALKELPEYAAATDA